MEQEITKEELCIQSTSHSRPILADISYCADKTAKPIIILAHGFKGFKDWGHFNLVAGEFAMAGFVFVKVSFSHNGTTPEHPVDFVDLDAFGNNNFGKELDDLGDVIDWLQGQSSTNHEMDMENLGLIGHSRGGGIVVIKASEDQRVKKLATWAGLCGFGRYIEQQNLDEWQKNGAIYWMNSRTNQQMPWYYQAYEDYQNNKDRYDVLKAAARLQIPYLIIHGANDEAVPVEDAHRIHQSYPAAEKLLIEGASHTFGAKHPFTEDQLPGDVQQVIRATVEFF